MTASNQYSADTGNASSMKVLLVTGRLAESQVRAFAGQADVLVADTDVAAFLTPHMLLRAAPSGYDLILIPGAITADFREAEQALGTKIRLGPKHAADLGFVLRRLDEAALSSMVPACELMEGTIRADALALLEHLEAEACAAMAIKGVKIGGGSRMKVLAEIVDATRYSPAALADRVRYYEEQGADMIDLGLSLDADKEQVQAAVHAAHKATDLPISIDTLDAGLIHAGLQAGVDLVLSLNGRNLPDVGKDLAWAGVPAVIIPGPGPITLKENIKQAISMGISAIADPVLDPPLQGLASSLQRYLVFSRDHPDTPLFFGAGNVTELLDADTTGVNALLAALGEEYGASIVFTPEYSAKAEGSVHELAIASRMMRLARHRKAPPKDLGYDLLIMKEKRHLPEQSMSEDLIEAQEIHDYEPDQAGSFRIYLNGGRIMASNGSVTVAGGNARDILNTIVKRGLVSRQDHAGYLGIELEKAEIALRLRRNYVQDEPLWPAEKS